MASGPWRTYVQSGKIAIPVAAALLVAGLVLKSRALILSGAALAGLFALPWALILVALVLAGVFLLVAFPIVSILAAARERRAKRDLRRILEEIDRLRPEGDVEDRLREYLQAMRSLPSKGSEEVLVRVRTVDHPFRLALMEFVSREVLEELAKRPDDPLATLAWRIALEERWRPQGQPVRTDLPAGEVEKLWRLALGSQDPFALPPELKG